jgi:hypothetical protein
MEPAFGVLRIHQPFGPSEETVRDDLVLLDWSRNGFRLFESWGWGVYFFVSVVPSTHRNLIFSSEPLRSAVLSLCWKTFVPGGQPNEVRSITFLHRCYSSFRESLSGTPTISTFYVCFTLLRACVDASSSYGFIAALVPLHPFEDALVHLSGMFRVVRILKSENGVHISDEDWDHIETRLLNALSLMERLAIFDDHGPLYARINFPVLAPRLHKIVHAADLYMVSSSPSQLDIPGLRYNLTVLSVRINCLFSSYMEPVLDLHQDQCTSHPRSEISSQLLPLVRTFLELLVRYDPCLDAFLHLGPKFQFFNADPRVVQGLIRRINSYCFASFLNHALLADEADRNDAKIQEIGMLCIGCLELMLDSLPIPWIACSNFLFPVVLGKMLLLPRSRFSRGTCVTST